MAALGALAARQAADQLAAILHDVEMPPAQRLGAVAAFGRAAALGAALLFPDLAGGFDMEFHLAAVCLCGKRIR